MNAVFKVARQEFRMTAANRAFVIITIIGPILILAVTVLPGLLTSRSGIPEGTTIAVVGAPAALDASLQSAAGQSGIRLMPAPTYAEVEPLLLAGAVNGILVFPSDYMSATDIRYVSRTGTDVVISEALRRIVGSAIVSARLAHAGLDAGRVLALSRQPNLVVERITRAGGSEKQDMTTILFTAIGFIMLLYMTVLLYGQMIGRSVVSEKTSKTVEIMLSSVRPHELLFGKIFGKGGAGLLQYAIWIVAAVLLRKVVGSGFGISTSQALSTANLAYLVLFFILAFFLYAGAYGMLGAGAEDEQHLGQLAWPLVTFLVIPLTLIGYLAIHPSAPFTVFLSFFPMTAPVVMLVRIIVESPPAWEIAVSVAILLLSIAGVIVVAGKVFRVGILMTGKRFSLRDIMRWIRY